MAAAVTAGRTLSVPNDMQSVNDILRSLEEGSMMTAFFKTKKPESSLFRVKLETRELIGARIRGCLSLMLLLGSTNRNIIRLGIQSRPVFPVPGSCINALFCWPC